MVQCSPCSPLNEITARHDIGIDKCSGRKSVKFSSIAKVKNSPTFGAAAPSSKQTKPILSPTISKCSHGDLSGLPISFQRPPGTSLL